MKKIKDIRRRMTKLCMKQRTQVISDFNSIHSSQALIQAQQQQQQQQQLQQQLQFSEYQQQNQQQQQQDNVIRIALNQYDEFDNGGDEDRNYNQSFYSRFQSTLSIDDNDEEDSNYGINRRKDPEYHQNRFKFTITEDKILITEVLLKIGYDKNQLKDFTAWKNIQDKYFEQRPVLELARRCLELITKYKEDQAKRKIDSNQFEEEKAKSSSTSQEKRTWTKEDDHKLLCAVGKHGDNNWREIVNYFSCKSSVDCRYRFLQVTLNRTKWTPEEDLQLMIGIKMFGEKRWSDISEQIFDRRRTDVQCRERYVNKLDPKIDHDKWTDEEERKLEELVHQYGSQWAKIQEEFQGKRTDNQCKRRWIQIINKQQKQFKMKKKKVLGKRISKSKIFAIEKYNHDGEWEKIQQDPTIIKPNQKKRGRKKKLKSIFKIEKQQ